jgi:deoxyribose-phosphate aldolase
MRSHCPPSVQIKAAGGVRSLDDLLNVRSWGVSRIGATATQRILIDACRRFDWPPPASIAVTSDSPAGY